MAKRVALSTEAAAVLTQIKREAIEASDLIRLEQDQEEIRERLNMALSRLSSEEREIALLKSQGDLTFNEIALAMGIPQATAATRYRSALNKMRAYLERA